MAPYGSVPRRRQAGGVKPSTNVGSLHCAAWAELSWREKGARPLTFSGLPDRSVLPCSQNCTLGAVVALFSIQPAAGMCGPMAQERYTTWLNGNTVGSIR